MSSFSPFWSSGLYSTPSTVRIGFSDGDDPRVLETVQNLVRNRWLEPVVIGAPVEISRLCANSGLDAPSENRIVDSSNATAKRRWAEILSQHDKKKALSTDQAFSDLSDSLLCGIALLLEGSINGLVAGSLRPTADVVRAALRFIGPRAGYRIVEGCFLIETEDCRTKNDGPFVFADCAVVPEPSSKFLAAIGRGAAEAYRFFTRSEPAVAFLSFSTRGSAEHPLVDRIRDAVALLRKDIPTLAVDGELQLDAALAPEVAAIKKASDSAVAGRANVFVFPTLEAGNIGYKLVQRFAPTRLAGPLLWGLDRPVSDLSRGCTVQEISDTAMCVGMMARGIN